MNQTQQETNVTTNKKKKKPMVIIILLLVVAITSSVFLGFKYYSTQQELTTAYEKLDTYKLATLPKIEKVSIVKTTEDYFNYILTEDFPTNYKLKLDGTVRLQYRDYTYANKDLPLALEFGSEFAIAYVEKRSEDSKHLVYFAVPSTELDVQTVKYMYVVIEDLTAELGGSPKASFTKAK